MAGCRQPGHRERSDRDGRDVGGELASADGADVAAQRALTKTAEAARLAEASARDFRRLGAAPRAGTSDATSSPTMRSE